MVVVSWGDGGWEGARVAGDAGELRVKERGVADGRERQW